MTGEEHIVAWIESSRPHYDRLLALATPGNYRTDALRALDALKLSMDALREMIRTRDAYATDHDAGSILRAAVDLEKWRLEQ